MSNEVCPSCCGSEHPSKLTCICGGSGKMQDAFEALHKLAIKNEQDIEKAVDALVSCLWLYGSHKLNNRGPYGKLLDAIEALDPEAAKQLRLGEDPANLVSPNSDDPSAARVMTCEKCGAQLHNWHPETEKWVCVDWGAPNLQRRADRAARLEKANPRPQGVSCSHPGCSCKRETVYGCDYEDCTVDGEWTIGRQHFCVAHAADAALEDLYPDERAAVIALHTPSDSSDKERIAELEKRLKVSTQAWTTANAERGGERTRAENAEARVAELARVVEEVREWCQDTLAVPSCTDEARGHDVACETVLSFLPPDSPARDVAAPPPTGSPPAGNADPSEGHPHSCGPDCQAGAIHPAGNADDSAPEWDIVKRDGAWWWYVVEYPEEGACGPFDSAAEAAKHALRTDADATVPPPGEPPWPPPAGNAGESGGGIASEVREGTLMDLRNATETAGRLAERGTSPDTIDIDYKRLAHTVKAIGDAALRAAEGGE